MMAELNQGTSSSTGERGVAGTSEPRAVQATPLVAVGNQVTGSAPAETPAEGDQGGRLELRRVTASDVAQTGEQPSNPAGAAHDGQQGQVQGHLAPGKGLKRLRNLQVPVIPGC